MLKIFRLISFHLSNFVSSSCIFSSTSDVPIHLAIPVSTKIITFTSFSAATEKIKHPQACQCMLKCRLQAKSLYKGCKNNKQREKRMVTVYKAVLPM